LQWSPQSVGPTLFDHEEIAEPLAMGEAQGMPEQRCAQIGKRRIERVDGARDGLRSSTRVSIWKPREPSCSTA